MDEFKVPSIPSTSGCSFIDTALSKEGLVATPERPPIAPSPGLWLDIGEIIEKELPEPQANLEGWGSVSPKKKPSIQETRHRAMMRGVGLEEKDLKKIYNYPGGKMDIYVEKLTHWQKPVARLIRRQFRNAKSAVATRKNKGRELDLLREKLERKERYRDELRARNEQLKVRLQEVRAKKDALKQVLENNPNALDPVRQGFCSVDEVVNWFHPGK